MMKTDMTVTAMTGMDTTEAITTAMAMTAMAMTAMVMTETDITGIPIDTKRDIMITESIKDGIKIKGKMMTIIMAGITIETATKL